MLAFIIVQHISDAADLSQCKEDSIPMPRAYDGKPSVIFGQLLVWSLCQ